MLRLSLAAVIAAVAAQTQASETFLSQGEGSVMVAALQGAPAQSPAASPARVPDQIIIAFKDDVRVQFTKQPSGDITTGIPELDELNRRHKLRDVQQSSARNEFLLTFDKGVDLDRALADYGSLKALVRYVQPNHILGIQSSASERTPVEARRVQERPANLGGAGLSMPSFDGAARRSGTRAPVYASAPQPKPWNSVTILGGGGSVDATGKGSTSFGGLYRRRVTPDKFPGSVGVEVGLVGTGSGGSYRVLEHEVYRPYYGYEEVYEVVRSVPGTRAWEFGGVNYETPRLGPVSFEAGLRAVRYSDDPRYTIRENNYANELVYRDCYDREHDRYYRCDYWTSRSLGGRILEQGTGSTASGFGHTKYGAMNVRLNKNIDLRVEADRTRAGRASGTGVRFGGRISW